MSSKVNNKLQEIVKNFQKEVEVLADQVRTETIIPLCEKHGLKFYSGMGIYFFSKGEKTYNFHDQDSSAYKKLGLKKAFDLLNLEVTYNVTLGDYMVDFPSDNDKE